MMTIEFSGSFIKDAAPTAVLQTANGQAIVPIDVDLQDPPELTFFCHAIGHEGPDSQKYFDEEA